MILYTGKTIRSIIILAFSLVIFSCEKGSESDIPSYLEIKRIKLSVSDGQGTSSQKITDAWVYLDDELIGAFELRDTIPYLTVPILSAGKHNLKVYPGIKMNGIASTRVPYTFYKPFEKEIVLFRDSIVSIESLTVKYATNTIFAWLEDFEESSVSIDTTTRSSCKLVRTSDPELVFHLPGEYNSNSGIANISSDSAIFECASHEAFELPVNGRDVFLELNYLTNNSVTVGLFVNTSSKTIQEPIIILNRNTTWNKIYINLTSALVNHQDALDFRIFFGMVKESGVAEAQFLVDNIKLVHL